MSKASFLEKLLDGVNVEWKSLGNHAEIYDGTHLTPKYTSSGVPFVSVQNIKDLYSTKKYISFEQYLRQLLAGKWHRMRVDCA
jgi:type I restriction enzyme S subunit